MFTGSLGTPQYAARALLVTMSEDQRTINEGYFVFTFNLKQGDLAELTGTMTGQGAYGWAFVLEQGAITFLGIQRGVYPMGPNTRSFRTLIRADNSGAVTIRLSSVPINSHLYTISQAFIFVRVIGRSV